MPPISPRFVTLAVLLHQTSHLIGQKRCPHDQPGSIEQDIQGVGLGVGDGVGVGLGVGVGVGEGVGDGVVLGLDVGVTPEVGVL